MEVLVHMEPQGYEQWFPADKVSGLKAIIIIQHHFGRPGRVRMGLQSEEEALTDALRLARA